MMKERSLFRRTGLVLTLAALMLAVAILSVQGSAPSAPPADDAGKPRADIIRIDGLKQFGKLERPAVVYLHEKHTQALSKKNKDCATCHLPDKKYMSTKFKRLTDASKKTVMDIYHDNCTACHRQTADAGEKAGPVVCTGCHQDRAVASSWTEIGMDKSLHYRHVKAQENKCEVCHHQYDPAAKKLVYVKGKEDDCRYCHLDKTVDNVISMRLASHAQCIDCHRKRLAENKDAGPATCGGCHDAGLQKKIAKAQGRAAADAGPAGCHHHPGGQERRAEGGALHPHERGALQPHRPRDLQRHLPGLPPLLDGRLRQVPHAAGVQGRQVRQPADRHAPRRAPRRAAWAATTVSRPTSAAPAATPRCRAKTRRILPAASAATCPSPPRRRRRPSPRSWPPCCWRRASR
ncbi:MAG: cytochrome c family protein [Desulfobacterales bacterium]|nr:cytochrome c family protein [Desulfobacterales bacterium]